MSTAPARGCRVGRTAIIVMVVLAGLASACAPPTPTHVRADDLLIDGLVQLDAARVSRSEADYLEAERLLEAAHAADRTDLDIAVALATVRASQHRFADAIELTSAVLSERPDRADALAARGDAFLAIGDSASAAADHRRLHEVDPGPASLVRLAHGLEESGDPWSARELARRALALQRVSEVSAGGPGGETAAWYRWRAGDLERHLGDLDAAEPLFLEALAIEPEYALARLSLIEISLERGDLTGAAELLDAWPGRSTLRIEAQLALAEAIGDDSAASDLRRELIEALEARDRVAAGLDLAAVLLDEGIRPQRALALTSDEIGRRRDAATLATHAQALLAVGRSDDAVPVVDEFLATGTNEPDRLAVAAAVFDATGDTARADSARARATCVRTPIHDGCGSESTTEQPIGRIEQ